MKKVVWFAVPLFLAAGAALALWVARSQPSAYERRQREFADEELGV